MKLKSVIIVLLCIFSVDFFAQEQQDISPLEINEEMVNIDNSDSLKYLVDSLYKVLLYNDSISAVNMRIVDSLKKQVYNDSLRIVSINRQVDSLLNLLGIKNKELIKLKSNMGFVDTCMVRLANRWLYEPFSVEDVNEAISYFDRIYSNKLKNDLSIVQELLKNYERSYREFQAILRSAQEDPNRESPFACAEYKQKYIQQIKDMTYYWKYYKKDWNIRYLNEQIDRAIEILNNHEDGKYADFILLMDPNFD